MNKLIWGILGVLCFIYWPGSLIAQEKLLDILQDEMSIQMKELKNKNLPPYYMSYRVVDEKKVTISASFGTLVQDVKSHSRIFVPQIRVGSPEEDNFSLMDMGTNIPQNIPPSAGILPLDENAGEEAIRAGIWNETNSRYKFAVNIYHQMQEYRKVTIEDEDKSISFSPAKVEHYYEAPLSERETKVNYEEWKNKLKEISAVFKEYPKILNGEASLIFKIVRIYFISSEGAVVAQNLTYANVMISGMTKADDGMQLPLNLSYFAYHPNDLPDKQFIIKETKEMSEKLIALRNAPIVTPYTGPVMLSGGASGVFFHEIFGHRIEGQRMRNDSDGQTFKKKIGELVLPQGMYVYDDPTLRQYHGKDLNGYYKYDEQGVKGERVNVVVDGKMNDFLMTRKPLEGHPQSNGHARAVSGYDPVSRQSNLIIEMNNQKTDADLRKILIDEIIAQQKEYGYFLKSVSGGFTMTSKLAINSFNVAPLEVYRVYADGRPDQLVRGVDLVGTPLMMFSHILCAGGTPEIFTGMCGAESGSIPVTAVSPSLVVKKVEMQRKAKSQDLLPILDRP